MVGLIALSTGFGAGAGAAGALAREALDRAPGIDWRQVGIGAAGGGAAGLVYGIMSAALERREERRT